MENKSVICRRLPWLAYRLTTAWPHESRPPFVGWYDSAEAESSKLSAFYASKSNWANSKRRKRKSGNDFCFWLSSPYERSWCINSWRFNVIFYHHKEGLALAWCSIFEWLASVMRSALELSRRILSGYAQFVHQASLNRTNQVRSTDMSSYGG